MKLEIVRNVTDIVKCTRAHVRTHARKHTLTQGGGIQKERVVVVTNHCNRAPSGNCAT